MRLVFIVTTISQRCTQIVLMAMIGFSTKAEELFVVSVTCYMNEAITSFRIASEIWVLCTPNDGRTTFTQGVAVA